MKTVRPAIALVLSLTAFIPDTPADEQRLTAEDVQFFETRIRPALAKYCYECHSAGAKDIGGKLLVDSRAGLQKGGEGGSAFVPGKPDESLLIHAVRYDGPEMPPDQRLPEVVVNDLVEWVRRGAPDPRVEATQAGTGSAPDEQSLWAFQPVQQTVAPTVKNTDWPRDAIDQFVLARIEAAKLQPAADADAQSLIRRMYIDLIGLPPSFEEVQKFVTSHQQNAQAAIAELTDELLASPRFGERWGRHWLDVARYGESNGNDGLGRNPTFPHAWRYRDFVITAFNNDMPYNQFLTEQIAGDLLPAANDAERDRHLIATGFLAMASKPAKAMNSNFAMDVVADQIDVIGTGIMGISVACARCHDHKFDPIPTRDYYALAGIFTSTETMWGTAANEGLTAPKTDLHVLKAAAHVPPPKDFVETVLVLESNTGKPKPIPKSKWPIGTPLAMGVRDVKKPADGKINLKGDAGKLGDAVPRGFLTACRMQSESEVTINPDQSGRLELAQWITRSDHPLTARVMVNRIWQHLFGQGLVSTPDDFGVYGARPTHPALLDHLALRFVDENWSMKRLIRAIVLSRTYQLSSTADESLRLADPENMLLTRHNRRRMDAESLRDSMLAVSGQLNLTPADGSIIRHRDILVNLAGNLHQPSQHRSVYLCYLRSSPPPDLAAFDLPDFTKVTGRRDVSTVPNQALHLYNSPFVLQQADALAQTVPNNKSEATDSLNYLWQRVFSRNATENELRRADELMTAFLSEGSSAEKSRTMLCQALLLTNEFRYVD